MPKEYQLSLQLFKQKFAELECHLAKAGIAPELLLPAKDALTESETRLVDAIAHAEQELVISRRSLLLLDTLNDWLWQIDAQGNYIYVSDKIRDFLGYEPEEVIGKTPFDLMPPEEAERVGQTFGDLVAGRQAFKNLENINRHKDGTLRTLSTNGVPVFENGNDFVGYLGSDCDITALKNVEQELREERDLFAVGPVFAFAFSPQTGWPVLFVSKNVPESLGYGAEEMMADDFHFADIIHPDDAKRVLNEVRAHIGNGTKEFEQYYRCRCKDGQYRWFLNYLLVQRDEFSGEVMKIHGYMLDQNRLKIAEETVLAQKELLEGIIEGTQAGTWFWNVQSGEKLYNERWAEILGYSLEELPRESKDIWKFLVHPDDYQIAERLVQQHFNGPLPYYEAEVRMKHKNGSWRWILDRGKVVKRDVDGRPLAMGGIHLDITDRKHLEKNLLASNSELKALYEGVPDAVIIADVKTRQILMCNDIVEELIGHDRPTLLSKTVEFLHPEDVCEQTMKVFERLVSGVQKSAEAELLTREGKRVPVSISSSMIIYNGKPCIMGVFRDISEIKANENKIREAYQLQLATNQQLKASQEQLLASKDELFESNQSLQASNQQLQASQQQLLASRQELFDSNQSLQASNQQLQASQQQLLASRQELFESNQSLQASAQQLEASNQQLKASQEQLLASRQELFESNQSLQASNQQLQASQQQLLASRQELFDSNQQLEASNQQLQASQQQLLASRQELFNSNQSLQASNQQLQASEQQLLASNQQLVAAEYRLKKKQELQELLTEISLIIMNPDRALLDVAINQSLEKIGSFAGADRSYIFHLSPDGRLMTNTYEWCGEDVETQISSMHEIPTEAAPWWMAQHRRMEPVFIADMAALPAEAEAEKKLLEAQGVRSCLALPMANGNNLAGFLGLDWISSSMPSIHENQIPLLQLGGDLIFSALMRDESSRNIIEREAKYRFIFESIHDIYLEIDAESGIIEEVSPSIWQLGYLREEVLQTRLMSYYADKNDQEEFLDDLDGKGTLKDYELSLVKKDGTPVTLSLSVSLVQNVSDKRPKIVGALRDISDRKNHEMQIKENIRLKNDFISSVSHELRAPLFSILGFSSTMLKDDGSIDQTTRNEFISIIHDESVRLSSLIEDILTISRIDSGKAKYKQQLIDPVDIGMIVVDILRKLASEKGIEIIEEYPAKGSLSICFDKDSLQQVLMNILGNALKFTLMGGQVWLRMLHDDTHVRIEVEDTGIGIVSSDMARIFERFFRSERSGEIAHGTGLGLAIVKDIVEIQGGYIEVESEVDKGSKFSVLLPFSDTKDGHEDQGCL